MIGASARIGIVCDATTYGMIPRRSTSNWASTTPRSEPDERTDDESDHRSPSREERRVEEVEP